MRGAETPSPPAGGAVLTAGARDRASVVALLARAFADDPGMSYIFPDPGQRAVRLPRLFGLLFDSDAAGMRLVTGNGEATTLWRGPGWVHTSYGEMLRRVVPVLATFGAALPRALRVSNAIAFWYFHIARCDPASQGRGFGAAAVRAGLSRAASRFPCHLETATERNLGCYLGLGVAVTAEWCVPRGGPRFWSMIRSPSPVDIEQSFI